MAAQDYFNDSSNYYSSRPYPSNTHTPYSSSTMDHTFGPSHFTPTLSDPRQDSKPRPPRKDQYADTSMRPPSMQKLDAVPSYTSNVSNTSNTAYPPSPEAQTSSQLLPKRKKKKKGFFSGRIAWVCYITALVDVTVFIVEIIRNSIVTGSPIMIHPQFNPMIGPSTYVLINMGARFVPCMRTDPQIQGANPPITWPCPNVTSSDLNDPSYKCDLNTLCGFGGLDNEHPDQWFRFIIPMFLHAGIIHIAFNMLLQLTMGKEMEQAIGSVRFAIVYFSSGIFGFVLGGNFAAKVIASTGASGCLFGVLALVLLDLIYHWNERKNPIRDLMWLIVDIVVSFVLGLLPGLDNFSHIGGFLMGLVSGICLLHSPNKLRERIGEVDAYRNVGSDIDLSSIKSPSSKPRSKDKDGRPQTAKAAEISAFTKEPVGFFKGRKPLWWAWWLLRAGALIGVLVAFVVLLNNFYKYHDTCSWCKYLSCLPVNGWCDLGNLNLRSTDGSSPNSKSKRYLAGVLVEGMERVVR
jgi:membrane associated rhomboid family serine protease